MKLLTIFTPTYNRAHTLARTYDSLCKQTSDDFEWIVIDDGSTDNTKKLVKSWIDENKIPIRYIKKDNGGLHTGYNVGIENCETELCVCIDSDDYMPNDAVCKITKCWNKNRSKNFAGIIGCDFKIGKNVPIGGNLPNVKSLLFTDITYKYHHVGDVKIVCRVDLLKTVIPMETFNNEKNFNPVYLYLQFNDKYEYIVLNENLCFVDYQTAGMTANQFKQYANSPRSFAQIRLLIMNLNRIPFKYKFRNYIHFVSSCIFLKDLKLLYKAPCKFFLMLSLPFGFILNIYIKFKIKKLS